MAVDGAGNVYLSGTFGNTVDFDPGAGVANLSGSTDPYVVKLDGNGNFVWAVNPLNEYYSVNHTMTVDQAGNVYLAGDFHQSITNPGTGTTVTSAGGRDAFAMKLDTTGALAWMRGLGGAGDDAATDLRVDADGNVHLVGTFQGTIDADPGTGVAPLVSAGGKDLFAITLDADGDRIETAGAAVMAYEDTLSGTIRVLPAVGEEGSASHFKISGITGGTLFLADGATPVAEGGFITVAQGAEGLRFLPTADSTANGGFAAQAATSAGGAGLGNAAVTTIQVIGTNDAPLVTVPAPVAGAEDLPLSITGLAVADIDGDSLAATLSVAHGTLTLGSTASLTVTGNGTASLSLAGTAAAINAALGTLNYQGQTNWNGTDSLTLAVSDGRLTDTDTLAIAVTPAQDAPVAAGDATRYGSTALGPATTGAMGVETFEIGGGAYLAVANNNTSSTIYTWSGDHYTTVQSIATAGAYDWESFAIGGETYLAVANCFNGSSYNLSSIVYKWNGTQFSQVQSIATSGAKDWESFEIAGETYLAVANYYDGTNYSQASRIYKWNGSAFAEAQSIQTYRNGDWESFQIDGKTYLAESNEGYTPNVYEWNGSQFVKIQDFDTGIVPKDLEVFQVGTRTFMAGAGNLHEWSAGLGQFVSFQALGVAFGWESFAIGGDIYLASAASTAAGIHKWNGTQFVQVQSIAASGTYDVESVEIGGQTWLQLAEYNSGGAGTSSLYRFDSVTGQFVEAFNTTLDLETGEGQALTVSAAALLANDTDPDGDALTLTAVAMVDPTKGTVGLAGGTITFTPSASFDALNGGEYADVAFTYTVNDGQGGTATGTATVRVLGANDAPTVTVPAGVTTDEDVATTIAGLAVADVDSDSLTVRLQAGHGALTLASTASLTVSGDGTGAVTLSGSTAAINAAIASIGYAPEADWNGADALTVTTYDGAHTLTDTVAITVTPVQDAPVAGDDLSRWGTMPLGGAIIPAWDLDAFQIDGVTYLSANSGWVNTQGDAYIYRWDGSRFIEVQTGVDNYTDYGYDHFQIGTDHYLAAVGDSGTSVYKFNPSTGQFGGVQYIDNNQRYDVESFDAGGQTYLATSNFSHYTKIYRWNGTSFQQTQSFGSAGIYPEDVETFQVGGQLYMAVAYTTNISTDFLNSPIYRWNGTGFDTTAFQTIATQAALDWEGFQIGGDTYLGLAEAWNYNVYKWNGSQFSLFQSFAVDYSQDGHAFQVGADHYLAVAIANGSSSKIYKWTGAQFVEFQTVATNDAQAFDSFVIDGTTFLVAANGDGATSAIWRLDPAGGQFVVATDLIHDHAATGDQQPLTITAASLLGNDTDVDGETLTITAVAMVAGDEGKGTVQLDQAGDVVFTPTASLAEMGLGDTVHARFTYTISDGHGGTDTAEAVVRIGLNDTLAGGLGDDTLAGGAGNDTLDGGAGTDTAQFSGAMADHVLTQAGGTLTVTGGEGTDRLTGIERLAFADGTLSVATVGETGVTSSSWTGTSVTALNNGGFLVTWSYSDAYGQRFDAAGAAQGAAFRINTYTTNYQTSPAAAALSDGGFVVTWQSAGQDASGNGVYGQRYDASGVAAGTEFRANTYTTLDQAYPSVAALAGGGFVVAWQSDGQDGSSNGVYAQRYDAAGVKAGTEFRINACTTSGQGYPSITSLADGGFVAAWQSYGQDGDSDGIYGQRYDAAGVAQGGEFSINTTTAGYQGYPSITSLADGGFVVTWQSNGSAGGVYGQRYDAAGAAQGGEFQVSANSSEPTVAALAGGGFVVTWHSYDGSGYNVHARRYDAAGAAQGGPFQVDTTSGTNHAASVAALADGGFVVTWEHQTSSGYDTAYAQRYDALGNRIDLTLTGTASGDTLRVGDGVGLVDGGTGSDTVILEDGGTAVTLQNVEAVTGGAGDDVVSVAGTALDTNAAGRTFDGGGGADTLKIAATGALTLDAAETAGLTGWETITLGGGAACALTLSDAVNAGGLVIDARGAASAAIDGSAEASAGLTVIGGGGADTFTGGAGADTLTGGAGNDTLDGGAGTDVAAFAGNAAGYRISASGSTLTVTDIDATNGDQGTDTLTGIETLRFADGDLAATKLGEFQVNTYTTNYQQVPSATALAGGGYVVAWQGDLQDGSSYGIFGQRYDAAGAKAGGEFQINTTTANTQINSSVAALPDGGFVVAWESSGQDGSLNGIYGQRYDANGNAQGSEFRVNATTAGHQIIPAIAALDAGGFVVTWQSENQDGSGYGVYGQRYDAAGVAQGGEFRINTYTTNSQEHTSVTGLTGGGFVVTWGSNLQDGSSYGVYGQRYDAAGTKVGGEFRVNAYTTDTQIYPSIAGLAGGGFVVTWSSNGQDGSSYGIYGQRYDASGVAQGGEFRINTYTTDHQLDSSVTGLGDGGFVVTWSSNGQDGSSYGVYGQRFDASGVVQGGEFRINTYTADNQVSGSVAALPDGSFVVTWTSSGQDGSGQGVYAQRFDASGNPVLIANALAGTINADSLIVGSGIDLIDVGAGDDFVNASLAAQSVTLQGGTGNDTLFLGSGNDYLDGGSGTDWARFDNASAGVVVNMATGVITGGSGDDRMMNIECVAGSAFNDIIGGRSGNDTILGGAGSDTLAGNAGNDFLDGGAGIDFADYSSGGNVVTVNLATGTASDGWGQTDTLTNIEGVIGSAYADTLTGGSGNDTLNGSGGNDTLSGGLGNDALIGGTGADVISFGGGANQLVIQTIADGAAAGANTGYDTVSGFNGAAGDMIVIDGALKAALDDLGGANGSLSFATDAPANFTSAVEGLVKTGLSDTDLTQAGFTSLIASLNSTGITAAAGDDGLIMVQCSTQTGIYAYQEDGAQANSVSANELTLLAVVDSHVNPTQVALG